MSMRAVKVKALHSGTVADMKDRYSELYSSHSGGRNPGLGTSV